MTLLTYADVCYSSADVCSPQGLSSLVQLSLEDNEIESLAGLSAVTTLLELYLGNNRVSGSSLCSVAALLQACLRAQRS